VPLGSVSAECPRNLFGGRSGRSLGDPPKRNLAPSGVGSGVAIRTGNASCSAASFTPTPGRSQAPTVALVVARERPSKTHWYAYDVLVNGQVIVWGSRDPEPDLARALLARGHTGFVDVIDARTGKSRSRVNIEKAARVETIEGSHGPFWRRQQRPTDRPYATETGSLGREIAVDVLSGAEGLSVE
jgi:hypothetical protein